FDIKPYEVKAKLRSYQKEGVKWLSMLDHYHFGGILADDMGLGKTLQTITLLEANLKPDQKALILAPASLLYNWKEEFRKFVPHKQVEVAYGSKTERIKQIEKSATITITSYPSFRSDL
ncbi:SNF2-related protein, partial [Streptococcus pneumoniae]|nr:SNF2-related protein [Streptococcus pneumoniae]